MMAHLVVEMVKEMEDAILIIGVMVIHILEQLDLVQTLVKVVLVILQHACCSQMALPHTAALLMILHPGLLKYMPGVSAPAMTHMALKISQVAAKLVICHCHVTCCEYQVFHVSKDTR